MYFDRSGLRLFSIAGIDVSVSIWYGVLLLFITFSGSFVAGLMAALALTVSLLIHEFGHAIPSKLYRLHPSILLHGFGGLCSHQPADSDFKDIVIVLAGPVIQIAFGGVVFGLMTLVPGLSVGLAGAFFGPFVWFSIAWGLVNLLLPVYPLDGGQLFHMVLRRFLLEEKAQDITLKTSILCAIVGGIYALMTSFYFLAFMAAFITMGNIATMQSGARLVERKAKIRATPFVKESIAAAERAFADEDWREAARLCHVLRGSNDAIPPKMMERVWEILALATVEQGEYEEAAGWLKHAPDSAPLRAARERVRVALEG